MTDELEQSSQMDVTEESSSSQEGDTSQAAPEGQPDGAEPKPESKEQYVPYERFKELIEQKNEFAKKLEEMERTNREFKSQFESLGKPKEASPEQKLIERLKGIDPEFGSWAEQQASAKAELEALKQWRTQYEQTTYLNSAQSAVDKVQSELKVDPTLHQMYLAQIPMGTPLDQIPARYKALHESVNKLIETQKREALSQYSQAKKVDSKTPAQARGKAPKTSAPKFSKNPEEARVQLRQEMLTALRASRQQ